MVDNFKKLEQYGAKIADEEFVKSLILSVEGETKQGRTHFAFTAPGPIGYINLDHREKGVIQKFQNKKDIHMLKPSVPWSDLANVKMRHASSDGGKGSGPTVVPKEMMKKVLSAWENLVGFYHSAIDAGMRTIVMDTVTDVWELLRVARFGKMDKIPTHLYAPVNMEMDSLLNKARESGTNLILINEMSDEYIRSKKKDESVKTGCRIRAGFKNIAHISFATLHIKYDSDDEEHKMLVRSCGGNPLWVGYEFAAEEVNFPFIAAALSSEEEDLELAVLQAHLEKEDWE